MRLWLVGHPDITVRSRDRGGGYGEATSKALPRAIQVADRWHLMENASSAFLSAIRKSMRPIRAAIGATTINPELLTCAERLQYEVYLRREETITTILALAKDGTAIKQIVRKTGHSRNRVRQVLRGDRGGVFRTRQSSLDAYLPLLDAEWAGGCRNGAKLWRRLKLDGFRVRCGWSVSGRPDAVAPKRPAISNCRRFPRLGARTHLSLEKDAPVSRAVDRAGHISLSPNLGRTASPKCPDLIYERHRRSARNSRCNTLTMKMFSSG